MTTAETQQRRTLIQASDCTLNVQYAHDASEFAWELQQVSIHLYNNIYPGCQIRMPTLKDPAWHLRIRGNFEDGTKLGKSIFKFAEQQPHQGQSFGDVKQRTLELLQQEIDRSAVLQQELTQPFVQAGLNRLMSECALIMQSLDQFVWLDDYRPVIDTSPEATITS